jgi:hypothetical protein
MKEGTGIRSLVEVLQESVLELFNHGSFKDLRTVFALFHISFPISSLSVKMDYDW